MTLPVEFPVEIWDQMVDAVVATIRSGPSPHDAPYVSELDRPSFLMVDGYVDVPAIVSVVLKAVPQHMCPPITGETSDGFHTFDELYDYRMLYNALVFNEWARYSRFDVHKSKRHHDGELCFGGEWFIVVATLPTGQISNHYRLADWDKFHVPARIRATTYDGHTPAQAADRMRVYLEMQER